MSRDPAGGKLTQGDERRRRESNPTTYRVPHDALGDLYGHLIDDNLWSAAGKIGGTTGASADVEGNDKTPEAG